MFGCVRAVFGAVIRFRGKSFRPDSPSVPAFAAAARSPSHLDLNSVQVSDIDAVDSPHAIGVALARRIGLSRADRTSEDQGVMKRCRFG